MVLATAKAVTYLAYLQHVEDLHRSSTMSFYSRLSAEQRRRRDRRVPRRALRRYQDSPFWYLFDSGDDQALLNVTGVDHNVFQGLLSLFEPLYYKYRPNMKTGEVEEVKKGKKSRRNLGRPRDLDATGCLGLVLLWYRTRGALSRGLALTFGMTCSPLSVWLGFGWRILLSALQEDPYARVSIPTQEDMDLYTACISAKYPVLASKNVWGAADGLKLHIQSPLDDRVQNNFYNGWKSRHFINSVFVFGADGRIRISAYNAPGCLHDSTIADYGVYKKIDEVYDTYGGTIVVDSAFQLGDRPCLIRSAQQDPVGEFCEVSLNRAATLVRQLSEWGMRTIQAQFPRLKDDLPYEEFAERRIILHLMTLVYNFTCSYIGHNQILSSYVDQKLSKKDPIKYYGNNFALPDDANAFVENSY